MNEAAVELTRADSSAVESHAQTALPRVSRWTLSLLTLSIAVGYAALNDGGRGAIAWTITLTIVSLAALAAWVAARADERAPALDPWLAWLVALAPGYVVLQLVPLPLFLLELLSPARARLVELVSTVTPDIRFAALSVNPAVTMTQLAGVVGCAVVFLLARDIAWVSRRASPWAAVLPLVVIAAFEASLAFVQLATGADARGTYASGHHLAGLLEMTLPLAVAMGVALMTRRRSRGGILFVKPVAGIATLCAAGVVLTALAQGSSTMGLIAALCGLLAMAASLVLARMRRRTRSASLAVVVALIAIALVAIPSARLVQVLSLADDLKSAEGLFPVWSDALRLVGDYPLTGTGLGAFASAFPKYQSAVVDTSVAFAGNDYLQLLAELGLLGAPLFIALFVTAHRRALRTATSGVDWNLELLGLGCTGAIAAIGVHSLVDFTARIPANALTLAWIAGLAASGPSSASAPGPMATVWRKQTIALACALVLLAPARLALASALRDNPGLERGLCRVGICSSDAPAVRGSGIVPRVDASLEALVRNPAEPSAWCDLGDAMLASGRVDEARLSFANALEVGPRKPIVHYRMASFHFELGETRPALAQAALALGETTDFDSRIFAMYIERRVPAASVLAHGLPPGPRPVQRYLRALIAADRPDEAAAVWEWALSMHDADDALARDYVHFRFRRQEYAQAARSWGQYVGDRTTGYLESSWIYDGGFEQAPAHTDFDWKLENLADSVIASIDPNVARSGKQSLKIRFAGDDNVDYHHTSQVVFVEPGVYRFSAQVRAMNVTTDQGLAFHLFDPHEPRQVDVWSPAVMATTGWTTLEQTVTVPANVPLLIVEIARQKSSRLDSHIAGTVWIDDVALSRIEQ